MPDYRFVEIDGINVFNISDPEGVNRQGARVAIEPYIDGFPAPKVKIERRWYAPDGLATSVEPWIKTLTAYRHTGVEGARAVSDWRVDFDFTGQINEVDEAYRAVGAEPLDDFIAWVHFEIDPDEELEDINRENNKTCGMLYRNVSAETPTGFYPMFAGVPCSFSRLFSGLD